MVLGVSVRRRIFAAPRATVFEAWTKPEKLEKWMCRDTPQSATRYWDFDIREGGGFHLEFRDLGDSTEVVLTHELLPTPELREGVRRGWNGCFDMLERVMYRRFYPSADGPQPQWISRGHGDVKWPLRQFQNVL